MWRGQPGTASRTKMKDKFKVTNSISEHFNTLTGQTFKKVKLIKLS